MAKNDEYREHYLDFPDPHESNEFWVRLMQVFKNSHHTLQSLADSINVPKRTVERFLNKQTHVDTMRMVYDIAYACGVRPEVFFNSATQIENLDLTGIKSIDKVLVDCYNDTSRSGIEGFRRYIADDYRLRNDRWRNLNATKNSRITSLLYVDEDGRKGLKYEDEVRLNTEAAEVNKVVKRLQLQRAYVVCDLVTVAYSIVELREDGLVSTDVVVRLVDHLKFEKPIEHYIDNPRCRPKISIRQWSQVKDPVQAVSRAS